MKLVLTGNNYEFLSEIKDVEQHVISRATDGQLWVSLTPFLRAELTDLISAELRKVQPEPRKVGKSPLLAFPYERVSK